MGSNSWREVKLSDLGEVARGRSRHRPRYAEHLYGGEYPFIQTGDIKASEGRISLMSRHTLRLVWLKAVFGQLVQCV
ncbi:TPA: hypothetical protein SMN05_001032 [Proteus mirabilis]|nr:hypothetical protein [Proteus mirabilis]